MNDIELQESYDQGYASGALEGLEEGRRQGHQDACDEILMTILNLKNGANTK